MSFLATSLALGSADYSWRRNASCKDTDPELFFPIGTTGQALIQISEAKVVCDECVVRDKCLDFALETNQDWGIWVACQKTSVATFVAVARPSVATPV